MLGAQAFDLIVDDTRLHGAAARAVDAQHDAGGLAVFECGLQGGIATNVIGVRMGVYQAIMDVDTVGSTGNKGWSVDSVIEDADEYKILLKK